MITRNLSKAAVFGAAAFYAASSNAFVNAFAATTIGSSRQCLEVVPTTDFGSEASCSSMSTTSTALYMGRGGGVRARGLEQRREGPTPTGTYGRDDQILEWENIERKRKNSQKSVY